MATLQDLQAQLAMLKLENEKLKLKAASRAPSVTLKVTDKGGVSMYGLGRFPVTLYEGQWLKLLDKADDVREFLTENKAKLSRKDD